MKRGLCITSSQHISTPQIWHISTPQKGTSPPPKEHISTPQKDSFHTPTEIFSKDKNDKIKSESECVCSSGSCGGLGGGPCQWSKKLIDDRWWLMNDDDGVFTSGIVEDMASSFWASETMHCNDQTKIKIKLIRGRCKKSHCNLKTKHISITSKIPNLYQQYIDKISWKPSSKALISAGNPNLQPLGDILSRNISSHMGPGPILACWLV